MFSKSQKRQRLIAFTFVNTIQYTPTPKNNTYHSNKRRLPPFFHSDTNPALGDVLFHSVNKTHVLVVTAELIWLLFLNIISLNFVLTLNESLGFTRFRGSYVNRPVFVLTNHCQSYTAFLLEVRYSKWPRSFFFVSACPQRYCICVLYFVEHTCCSNGE